jgi:hypothetical protein
VHAVGEVRAGHWREKRFEGEASSLELAEALQSAPCRRTSEEGTSGGEKEMSGGEDEGVVLAGNEWWRACRRLAVASI